MTTAVSTITRRYQCMATLRDGYPCGTQFDDDTGRAPCPQCGNDDDSTINLVVEEEEAPARRPQKQAAPHPVKSAALQHGKAAPQRKVDTRPSIVIGLFAFLFGAPAWLEGARTTRDGWVFGVNWLLDRVGIPLQIPSATTWHWGAALALMVVLGWAYSRVELRWVPIHPPADLRRDFFNGAAWYVNHSLIVWLIWVLVLFTDVVTMFLGARQVAPGDPAFLRQIAESMLATWIYAIMITFIPDRLVRYGWRSIRR